MSRPLRIVLVLAPLAACAPLPPPAPVAPPVPQGPEEGDLIAVVPAPAQAVLWIDMALLRGSRWARPVLTAGPAEERAARTAARGFDDLEDVDVWVLAKAAAVPGGAPETLEVLQGRFDSERVRRAFLARQPQAREESLPGGTRLLAQPEAALAFLGARTLILGPPAQVRDAVAAAWHRGRSARDERWLAEMTAALEDEVGRRGRGTALELLADGTDEVKAALREALGGPGEAVRRLGAMLVLAADARAVVVAVASDRAAAGQLAQTLAAQRAALRARRSIAALGLRPVLDQLQISARGTRAVAELKISEGDREQIAQRLAALAELLKSGSGR